MITISRLDIQKLIDHHCLRTARARCKLLAEEMDGDSKENYKRLKEEFGLTNIR